MSVAGVILAAGASVRLGRSKQLVLVDGEPLLRRTARLACATTCARIAVVVGARADELLPTLGGLDVDVVVNHAWAEGMAASVRAGVAWAEARAATGLLLLVCDQPRLTGAHLGALLAAHAREGGSVGSAYAGAIGVPAVIDRTAFGALAELRGDRGARGVLAGGRAIPWEDGAIDVDRADDLADLG